MTDKKNIFIGHLFAFVTILIWSVAFVSNKVLLDYLTPIEIMIYRFALGYIIMLFIYPRLHTPFIFKDELFFALLGGLGVFIYFLFENFALQYTQATNVGLYMGAIPIFTAIVAHFVIPDEHFSKKLIIGFIIAMVGMGMILFEGREIELRLLGDSLALLGAITFAIYSALLKIAPKGYHYIVATRKSFLYALLMMLLYTIIIDHKIPSVSMLHISTVYINILFLGVLSSVVAFILWNLSIQRIGSISASNYIYLVPLLTASTGVVVLDEKITLIMLIAGTLILVGLYISQKTSHGNE